MSEIQKIADRLAHPGAATKRVRVCLSALTRQEYSEVVTVPVETTESDLDALVSSAYDEVDGSLFSEDVEYWEKGTCRHEKADGTKCEACQEPFTYKDIDGGRCLSCGRMIT